MAEFLQATITISVFDIIQFIIILVSTFALTSTIVYWHKFERSYEENIKLADYDRIVSENEKLKEVIKIKTRR